MHHIPNGMSLRDALSLARRMGLVVRYAPGTGEWIIRGADRSVRHNARRKVASRALVCLLRRARQQAAALAVHTTEPLQPHTASR
jgi:hypothetical protein